MGTSSLTSVLENLKLSATQAAFPHSSFIPSFINDTVEKCSDGLKY